MKTHEDGVVAESAAPAAPAAPTTSARALARVLIACVVPMLNSASPQNAQSVLNTIAVLLPHCDLRRLQALTHYRQGEYVEAMQCWETVDDMTARAFCALCLRHIGEPSWWGAAQLVYDSGDVAAMEVLEPWMNETPEASLLPAASRPSATDVGDYPFRPLRA